MPTGVEQHPDVVLGLVLGEHRTDGGGPLGGRVEILGHDAWRDPARAKSLIGVLPDGLRTFDRLSGRELLRHTGLLHGVDVIDVARRSDQLLDALGLDEAADKIVADYSANMTKKIGLACALIHAPRVWARGSSSGRCPNCSRRSTPEPCDALTGASRHARDCMGTHR